MFWHYRNLFIIKLVMIITLPDELFQLFCPLVPCGFLPAAA